MQTPNVPESEGAVAVVSQQSGLCMADLRAPVCYLFCLVYPSVTNEDMAIPHALAGDFTSFLLFLCFAGRGKGEEIRGS